MSVPRLKITRYYNIAVEIDLILPLVNSRFLVKPFPKFLITHNTDLKLLSAYLRDDHHHTIK